MIFLLSEKLWLTARKIASDVVNSYACNGMVSVNDPTFDDKFKAAYAVVVLGQPKAGDRRLAQLAKAIVIQAYPKCKLPKLPKDFVEKFLSSFTETVVAKVTEQSGLDLSRIQGARFQLVSSSENHRIRR